MAELSKLQLEVDARSAIAAAEALERLAKAAENAEKKSKIVIGGTSGTGKSAPEAAMKAVAAATDEAEAAEKAYTAAVDRRSALVDKTGTLTAQRYNEESIAVKQLNGLFNKLLNDTLDGDAEAIESATKKYTFEFNHIREKIRQEDALSKQQLAVDSQDKMLSAEKQRRAKELAATALTEFRDKATNLKLQMQDENTLLSLHEKRNQTINKLTATIKDAGNKETAEYKNAVAAISDLQRVGESRSISEVRNATARGNAAAAAARQAVMSEDQVSIAMARAATSKAELNALEEGSHKRNIQQREAYRLARETYNKIDNTMTREEVDNAQKLGDAYKRLGQALQEESKFSLGAIIRKGGILGDLVGMASSFYIVTRAIGTFIDGAKALVGPTVEAAMAVDQMNRSYAALAGDQGQQLSVWIRETARASVVTTEAWSASAKQLLGFGFAADEVMSILPMLADAAQGNSQNFTHLALVYGQVRAQGKALQQDMYQFVNAGIPIMEALADVMGKPTSEIRDLVRAGSIDLPVFEAAIKRLTSEGGRFFEYNKKLGESAIGSWQILRNEWRATLAEFGMGILPTITNVAKGLTAGVRGISSNSIASQLVQGNLKFSDIENMSVEALQRTQKTISSEIWRIAQVKGYTDPWSEWFYQLFGVQLKEGYSNALPRIEEAQRLISEAIANQLAAKFYKLADPWQIIEGVGPGKPYTKVKLTEDQELVQKTIKEMKAALAAVDQNVLLGIENDAASAKQKIFEAAAKGLTEKGFTAGGSGLKLLVEVYRDLTSRNFFMEERGLSPTEMATSLEVGNYFARMMGALNRNAEFFAGERLLSSTEIDEALAAGNYVASVMGALNRNVDFFAGERLLSSTEMDEALAAGNYVASVMGALNRNAEFFAGERSLSSTEMDEALAAGAYIVNAIGALNRNAEFFKGERGVTTEETADSLATGQYFASVIGAQTRGASFFSMERALSSEEIKASLDLGNQYATWVRQVTPELEKYRESVKNIDETISNMATNEAIDFLYTSFESLGEALATGSINMESFTDNMLASLDELAGQLSKLFLQLAFNAASLGLYYESLGWLALAGVSGIAAGFINPGATAANYALPAGEMYLPSESGTTRAMGFGNEGASMITSRAIARGASNTNVSFQIIDQTSKSVAITQEATTDANGVKTIRAVIRDVVSTELATGGFDRQMKSRYAVGTSGVRRL